MEIREDWLCTFCNKEIEDLGHLFWECHFTQLFWKDFLNNILHGKQVTKNDIFFGVSRFSRPKKLFTFPDFQKQYLYYMSLRSTLRM